MSMSYKYGDSISEANMIDYLDKAIEDIDVKKIRLINGAFYQVETLTWHYGENLIYSMMDFNDDALVGPEGLKLFNYGFLLNDCSD